MIFAELENRKNFIRFSVQTVDWAADLLEWSRSNLIASLIWYLEVEKEVWIQVTTAALRPDNTESARHATISKFRNEADKHSSPQGGIGKWYAKFILFPAGAGLVRCYNLMETIDGRISSFYWTPSVDVLSAIAGSFDGATSLSGAA